VLDDAGALVGVVRVGLLAEQLDVVTRLQVEPGDASDPHRVFLADAEGRLVTRLQPGHALLDQEGELRPTNVGIPEEVRVALSQPALRDVSADQPQRSARFEVAGRAYLLSALALPGTQDWRVGIVVPEDHYLGSLERTRRMLLGSSAFVLLAMILAGALALRSVQAGLARIVHSAARMRDFDFSPSAPASAFRDVGEVMEDLEQAKTALRALGKYVPLALVRQLYRARQEPRLGGELRDLSMLFTDIRDFTSFSERLAPDALAAALGRYLEAMTGAVHAHGGTVDKYIGDAVMALWNAPEACADHAARACAAALACRAATEALFASPAWQGLPPFYTRFGVHRDEVMVGHFGAPDRLSYTALGDGVNLASRLEGLNKSYGTQILVSEAVRQAVGDAFAFRLVDIVAVKGRSQGVSVYELLGTVAQAQPATASYERAFEAYQQRRFAEALGLLEALSHDPPSQVLASRCRQFLVAPPPPDWDGIFIAQEK
jgi:adenylate cyclase